MKQITQKEMVDFLNQMVKDVNDCWKQSDKLVELAKSRANEGKMENAITCYKEAKRQLEEAECYSLVAERFAKLIGYKYIEDAQEHEVFVVEDDYNE